MKAVRLPISIKQAAGIIGVSETDVCALIDSGALACEWGMCAKLDLMQVTRLAGLLRLLGAVLGRV